MSISSFIKRSLRPAYKKAQIAVELLRAFLYDAGRFVRYSGVFRKTSHTPSLGALITKQYHRIEKGLALPHPRPGFGEKGIKELCSLVVGALNEGSCYDETVLAIDALRGYRDFNLKHDVQPQPWLIAALDAAERAKIANTGSPVREVFSKSSHENEEISLIVSRPSVRDFSDAPVPDIVLENAVRAAQHAPCVCNRQSGRVYLLQDKNVKDTALSYQNGNRGFGAIAPVVAIITVDQSEMLEAAERYQHWIDGGMFAQNFLLGIHAQGYGACPLNWSAAPARDQGLRKALGIIPDSQTIIMLVAIGALKEHFVVARSNRRQMSNVMTKI